jgi:hypothetical protein
MDIEVELNFDLGMLVNDFLGKPLNYPPPDMRVRPCRKSTGIGVRGQDLKGTTAIRKRDVLDARERVTNNKERSIKRFQALHRIDGTPFQVYRKGLAVNYIKVTHFDGRTKHGALESTALGNGFITVTCLTENTSIPFLD